MSLFKYPFILPIDSEAPISIFSGGQYGDVWGTIFPLLKEGGLGIYKLSSLNQVY